MVIKKTFTTAQSGTVLVEASSANPKIIENVTIQRSSSGYVYIRDTSETTIIMNAGRLTKARIDGMKTITSNLIVDCDPDTEIILRYLEADGSEGYQKLPEKIQPADGYWDGTTNAKYSGYTNDMNVVSKAYGGEKIKRIIVRFRVHTEPGYDFVYLDESPDGVNWTVKEAFDGYSILGTPNSYKREIFNNYIRFRFTADNIIVESVAENGYAFGCAIDEVKLYEEE